MYQICNLSKLQLSGVIFDSSYEVLLFKHVYLMWSNQPTTRLWLLNTQPNFFIIIDFYDFWELILHTVQAAAYRRGQALPMQCNKVTHL